MKTRTLATHSPPATETTVLVKGTIADR